MATISPRASAALGGGDGGVGPVDGTGRPFEPEPRAAVGAGHRLGVEAAVGGIVVLGRAGGAQGEVAHGRVGPVVGEPERDGEAGTAVGAVDERVAGTAVAGSKQLGQAVVAHGDVGGDEGAHGAGRLALDDPKAALVAGLDRRAFDAEDPGQGRGVGDQAGLELVHAEAGCPRPRRTTPSVSLPTWPARPSSVARRCTKGRKPTPCTTPATRIRWRTGAPDAVSAVMRSACFAVPGSRRPRGASARSCSRPRRRPRRRPCRSRWASRACRRCRTPCTPTA